jgi:3-dehydroquinate synthase
MAIATIPVALGERSYDVLVGPGVVSRAADLIAPRVAVRRCVIVTDATVAQHHLCPLEASLRAADLHAGTEVLPPGETTKSFHALGGLCERLLAIGLERGDAVIALGGGVIGDLAGFAASIVRRGLPLVQMPTTLLAQVDSSVGGKTAVNSPHGKNLLGTFHQPCLVLADTDVLSTLPPRQFRAGYVEAAKFGLLGDAQYFTWLERNRPALFARDAAALTHAIAVAVRGKAAIVARDERETGERMLLNLGHTFAHALEAWSGYSERLLHGEAVAIGICLAFRLSEELGLIGRASVARVEAHFAAFDLPTRIADVAGTERPEPETLLGLMGQDKKVRAGRLTLILVRAIGEAFVTRDVSAPIVRDFLSRQLALARS